jgi:hypothetical protein
MLNFPRALSHAFFYALSKGGFEFFEGKKTECKIQKNVLTCIQNGFDYYYLWLVETVSFNSVVATDRRVDLKSSVYNVSFQLMDSTMTSTLFKYDLLNLGDYAFNVKLIKDTSELIVEYVYDDYTPQTITPYVLSLKNDIFYYYKNQVDSKWYGDLPDEFIALLNEDYGTFNLDDSLLYLFTPSIFAFDIIPSSHGYDASVEAVGFSGSGVKVNEWDIGVPKPPRPTPTPPIPPSPPIPPTPPPRPPDPPPPPAPPTPPVYPPTPTGFTYLFTGTVEEPIDVLPNHDYVQMYFNPDCYRVDSKPYKIDVLLTDHYFKNISGQTGKSIPEYYYNVEQSDLYFIFNMFSVLYDMLVNDNVNTDGDWSIVTNIDFWCFKIGFTKSTQQNTDGDTTISLKITEVSASDNNIYFVGIKNAEDIFTIDATSYSYEHKTAVTSKYSISWIAFPHITFPTNISTTINCPAGTENSYLSLTLRFFLAYPNFRRTAADVYNQYRGLLSNIYVNNIPFPEPYPVPPLPPPDAPDYPPFFPSASIYLCKGDFIMPIIFSSNELYYTPNYYHVKETPVFLTEYINTIANDPIPNAFSYVGLAEYYDNCQFSFLRMIINAILMNYIDIHNESDGLSGDYRISYSNQLTNNEDDVLVYECTFGIGYSEDFISLWTFNVNLYLDIVTADGKDNHPLFAIEDHGLQVDIGLHSVSTTGELIAEGLGQAATYIFTESLNPFPNNDLNVVIEVPEAIKGGAFDKVLQDTFDLSKRNIVFENLYKGAISSLYSYPYVPPTPPIPDYPDYPDGCLYLSSAAEESSSVSSTSNKLLFNNQLYRIDEDVVGVDSYATICYEDSFSGYPRVPLSEYVYKEQISIPRIVFSKCLEYFYDILEMGANAAGRYEFINKYFLDSVQDAMLLLEITFTLEVDDTSVTIKIFNADLGLKPSGGSGLTSIFKTYFNDGIKITSSGVTVDSETFNTLGLERNAYLFDLADASGIFPNSNDISMQMPSDIVSSSEFGQKLGQRLCIPLDGSDAFSYTNMLRGLVSCIYWPSGQFPLPPITIPYPPKPEDKDQFLCDGNFDSKKLKDFANKMKQQKAKEKNNG